MGFFQAIVFMCVCVCVAGGGGGGGGGGGPKTLPKISHTYPAKMKLGTIIP